MAEPLVNGERAALPFIPNVGKLLGQPEVFQRLQRVGNFFTLSQTA